MSLMIDLSVGQMIEVELPLRSSHFASFPDSIRCAIYFVHFFRPFHRQNGAETVPKFLQYFPFKTGVGLSPFQHRFHILKREKN